MVLGFSYLTKDTQAQFSLFTKGSSGSWDTGSVSSMVIFKGGNISMKKGNETVVIHSDGLGKWTDVAVVMNYKSRADIYVNGVLKGSRSFNTSIVDTDYFGFELKYPRYTDEADAETLKKYASFYFDDIYVYKASSGMSSGVLKENSPVNYKTTEATVDFGQNLVMSDASCTIELNGESVDYDLIEDERTILFFDELSKIIVSKISINNIHFVEKLLEQSFGSISQYHLSFSRLLWSADCGRKVFWQNFG
jgi:hypothetical protein